MILRIEDIDSSRVRPGMAELAMTDLRWIGLDWDEGPDIGGPASPYYQSMRIDRYAEALDILKKAELVYPCSCTRSDIQRVASAPHLGEEGLIYPGTCSGRSVSDADNLADRMYAWRFRVDRSPVSWNDLFRGLICASTGSCVGDFIVWRSDGIPSYQLATVVDDAAMGVTQVIRGDDLISSTPRQLVLYQALGLKPPRFGHVPLVIGQDGRRLAKRNESIKLQTLRKAGISPKRILSWIGRSIGCDIKESEQTSDLIGHFRADNLSPHPVVFDPVMIGFSPGAD